MRRHTAPRATGVGLCRPRRPHSAAGFTLVELILVIAIVGIVSFVAAGRLADRGLTDAHGHAERIAALLRHAQKTAIAQRRPVHVGIDAAAGRVRACFDPVAACAPPLPSPSGGTLDLAAPAGVSLISGAGGFSFDGLGRPTLAASLEIRTFGGGHGFALQVEADSGYVRRL
jgi:MSHA pilin protein MshC